MPILVNSAKATSPADINASTSYPAPSGGNAGNGVFAYSGTGTSHISRGGPNEDAFLAAIVDEGMIPNAESAKGVLRELRDSGASAIAAVKARPNLDRAGATLAAVATFGDWSDQGNLAERGFAIVCPGDSGIAWRDKSGRVTQLTIAQETVQLQGGQHPIYNNLGVSQGRTYQNQAEQDAFDQVRSFTESELLAMGINIANGELIVFCDGIIQRAQTSQEQARTTQIATQAQRAINTERAKQPPDLPDQTVIAENRRIIADMQSPYDDATKISQAGEIERLYVPNATNRAVSLAAAAGNTGSNDDRTAIIIEMPPTKGQRGQRIVYMCDGMGGHGGGWDASNAAVRAAEAKIVEMEQTYALQRQEAIAAPVVQAASPDLFDTDLRIRYLQNRRNDLNTSDFFERIVRDPARCSMDGRGLFLNITGLDASEMGQVRRLLSSKAINLAFQEFAHGQQAYLLIPPQAGMGALLNERNQFGDASLGNQFIAAINGAQIAQQNARQAVDEAAMFELFRHAIVAAPNGGLDFRTTNQADESRVIEAIRALLAPYQPAVYRPGQSETEGHVVIGPQQVASIHPALEAFDTAAQILYGHASQYTPDGRLDIRTTDPTDAQKVVEAIRTMLGSQVQPDNNTPDHIVIDASASNRLATAVQTSVTRHQYR